MSEQTISEKLFERFCKENKIQLSRIEVSIIPGKKEPDYEIETSLGKVLVEVKQFDPNSEELKLQKQLEDRGWTDAFGGEPGAKVRLKIQSAAKQLKSRGAGSVPSMVVLYNNVPISRRGTDPYEIKTAMYGMEKIDFSVASHISGTSVKDRGFGTKRKMTQSSNTSISAVAALYSGLDQQLLICVFHNIYAAKPLDIHSFQGEKIKHYAIADKVPGQFQEWKEIGG
ncbi:hypothetical protein [Planktothrix mougeotii]|uniref:Restriction endonuclease n=1 Tax=Planktothrix mougeotii LEGE 06226 TaxID=1828728 RepID=A0ABR9UKC7_9CYAN|nr:hypothetical protein [Planktothrix mougeotii]MBE9146606.1 hypothetical protein [Planktothrix mougeotii LEGE 06226]